MKDEPDSKWDALTRIGPRRPAWRNQRRFIYGLFDGESCAYIGSTSDPIKRERKHLFDPRFSQLKFKILDQSYYPECFTVEREMIVTLKKLGQAQHNVRIPVPHL